jgi:hypothetical protein
MEKLEKSCFPFLENANNNSHKIAILQRAEWRVAGAFISVVEVDW